MTGKNHSIQIDIDGFVHTLKKDGKPISDPISGYQIVIDDRFKANLPYINEDEAKTIADIIERAKYRT